jgi:crotonobetainyl-CoA:carnitine CoA-transferase CaiB-like acyl-CoA transferase
MRKGHLQLDANRDDQSTYFTRINVGKQSVGLDLGRPETRDVVR